MDSANVVPPVEPVPSLPPQSFPPPARAATSAPGTDVIRWLYTHNPFYILSAALVFWGLHSSFETKGATFQTIGLMIGLLAYTILLAVTTFLVIRLGKVWQDGRSQLLLLVLMFLAISVSFDDTLPRNPALGILCEVGGLLFAVVTSESLLCGIRLRLPAWYRIPYYLTLAISFLAPIVLFQFVEDPFDPRGQWALFAVPAVAGAAWLTLLPAIRRGAAYVENNGSPWRWPLYPWSLFVLLALAVCQRSYFLCVSMHYAGGQATIFGPYFLIPFLFVLGVLLLEIGLVSRSAHAIRVALLVPVALLGVAAIPVTGRISLPFLELFERTLGASPLFLTLLGASAFYAWALLRGVPRAAGAISAALLAFSVVGPATRDVATLVPAQGFPFLLVAGLQGVISLRSRKSLHCLLSLWCLIAAMAIDYRGTGFTACGNVIPWHVALGAVLVVGAVFRDKFAEFLRFAGAILIFFSAIYSFGYYSPLFRGLPESWVVAYPLAVAAVAVVYGYLVRIRLYYGVAGTVLVCWLATRGWRAYLYLRQFMAGLDYIAWGLASFLVAIWISLLKAGLPQRWLASSDKPADAATDAPALGQPGKDDDAVVAAQAEVGGPPSQV